MVGFEKSTFQHHPLQGSTPVERLSHCGVLALTSKPLKKEPVKGSFFNGGR